MKATGIIRRIDDLGRIVIPKEIRKSMGIKEGDTLEVYTIPEENAVAFSLYKPDHKEQLKRLEEVILDEFYYHDYDSEKIAIIKSCFNKIKIVMGD